MGAYIENVIDVLYCPHNGKQYSMEDLAHEYLGFNGYDGKMKSVKIGRSNQERINLSMDQIKYVAIDAYVSRHLGVAYVEINANFF